MVNIDNGVTGYLQEIPAINPILEVYQGFLSHIKPINGING